MDSAKRRQAWTPAEPAAIAAAVAEAGVDVDAAAIEVLSRDDRFAARLLTNQSVCPQFPSCRTVEARIRGNFAGVRAIEEAGAMGNPHDFHVPKAAYAREDLLASGRGGYFGPGNAQLPAPPMLMMDRITAIDTDGGEFGKGHVVAELDVTPDLWFFDCHFVGDPVMPGCLGLDAMWQLVGYWLGWSGSPGKGRAVGVGEVRFKGDVTPANRLVRYEVSLRQVRRGRLAVGVADGKLYADGACIYTAAGLRVGMLGG